MSPNGDSQDQLKRYADFAARLSQRAELAGFNSSRLAIVLNIGRGTMGRYWSGERITPPELLFRIADIIKASPRWLVTGTGSAEAKLDHEPFAQDSEEQLLRAFRKLSDEQQDHIIQSAEMLAEPRTLHSKRSSYRSPPAAD